MNIILFTQQELADGVELDDHRAAHVRNVLSISDGHTFDAGVINGMRGKAKFGPAKDGKLEIDFETTEPSSELYPCLLYTSPSPRDGLLSRMPSSA